MTIAFRNREKSNTCIKTSKKLNNKDKIYKLVKTKKVCYSLGYSLFFYKNKFSLWREFLQNQNQNQNQNQIN